MINQTPGISLRTAALIAALPVFVPAAPFAEFYVFGKLISSNAAQTSQNLLDHPILFISGIFAIFFIYMYDIVHAWALYIFLKSVNAEVSLLAAWFRIIYAGLAMTALLNFIYAFHLVSMPGLEESYRISQVMYLLNARKFGMHLAYIIFGFHLIISGVLIYRSIFIPRFIGVLISLAGISWIVISLKSYFFRQYDLSWMMAFSVGELIFAIWLLVKGTKIKDVSVRLIDEV